MEGQGRVVMPIENPSTPEWYENVSLEDAEIFIHANLKSAARSVIAIGYYLKCVKGQALFAKAGFKDIYDYARERFGFSSSTTSRYMTRNDKFSVGGNSPLLDEKYKDFNKSQLQEMLNLESEQLEKVTPEMTVVQIREMKKPKEIPYIEIPGQVELSDFPGIRPDDAKEADRDSQLENQSYTISAVDLLAEQEQTDKSIAISQPKKTETCIHRSEFACTLDEAHKLIPGDGKHCEEKCCWNCTKHGSCKLECYSSEQRLKETEIDGEFTEVHEPEGYTPRYFLEEQSRKLDEMLAESRGELKAIERQKTIVCALAAMVSELEGPMVLERPADLKSEEEIRKKLKEMEESFESTGNCEYRGNIVALEWVLGKNDWLD